ncbi:MAG: hypothetical protein AAGG80_03025, partial [Pseudomonadota bacterium]
MTKTFFERALKQIEDGSLNLVDLIQTVGFQKSSSEEKRKLYLKAFESNMLGVLSIRDPKAKKEILIKIFTANNEYILKIPPEEPDEITCLAAVTVHPSYINFLNEKQFNENLIERILIESNNKTKTWSRLKTKLRPVENYANKFSYESLIEILQVDKLFIKEMTKKINLSKYNALQLKQIYLTAVEQNPLALEFVDHTYIENKHYYAALEKNWRALKFVPKALLDAQDERVTTALEKAKQDIENKNTDAYYIPNSIPGIDCSMLKKEYHKNRLSMLIENMDLLNFLEFITQEEINLENARAIFNTIQDNFTTNQKAKQTIELLIKLSLDELKKSVEIITQLKKSMANHTQWKQFENLIEDVHSEFKENLFNFLAIKYDLENSILDFNNLFNNHYYTQLNQLRTKKDIRLILILDLISPFTKGFGKIKYIHGLLTCAQIKSRKSYNFNPTIVPEESINIFLDYLAKLAIIESPIRERFCIAGGHWHTIDIEIT